MGAPNLKDTANVPDQIFDAEPVSFGLVVAPLAGTVTAANGTTGISFSQNQSLPVGTVLYFANQPGVPYTLAADVVASMTGTLTTQYTGPSNNPTPTATTAVAIPGLDGTVTVTNGSANITFSQNQTLTKGTLLQFSSQPGVFYTLNAAIAGVTAAVLTATYNGTTSSTATTLQAPALAGTVAVNNGSPNITFSVNQTLAAGTALLFGSQTGQPYFLAANLVAGTAGVLTTNYTGTTAAATTTVPGTADYVPARNGGAARGLYCVQAGTAYIDTYGLTGQGSGNTFVPVPMNANQLMLIALVKVHQYGLTGQFLAVF
jgi:hypothetical protein